MIESSARRYSPRLAAMGYGAGIAVVGTALSLLGLALAIGRDPDGGGFVGMFWTLLILPGTASAGCASIWLFDRFERLVSRWQRVGFFFCNALIVAVLPYAIVAALFFLRGDAA